MRNRYNAQTIAPPPLAVDVDVWEHDDPDSIICSRTFQGVHRGDDHSRVQIIGAQTSDGRITERFIAVQGPSGARTETAYFDAATARTVAADLLTAADEWESLAE